jgi:hypothetical protein
MDRVVFRPRGGGHYEGTIVRIGDRAAVVEIDDPSIVPAPGTAGDVRVPESRLATPVVPVAPANTAATPAETAQPAQQQGAPEHPPWERTGDDGWDSKQPLLARVRPLRPYERDSRVSGRVYTIDDFNTNTEGNTKDVFLRMGASVLYENVFGKGGDLHVDGEVNYRKTDVPDNDDAQSTHLRLDRLSYSWGGDRFSPNRFEVGRFLHHGVPEFGVLDGFEWDRRMEGGNTFGFSSGYLPEPDADMKTGRDLGFATWYRWVYDESEIFSMTGAYEKTFHNYDADRDLFIAKVEYLPGAGWTFNGTAWVDLYGDTDPAKGSGLELTQAYVTTGRIFESGSSLRFTYTHQAFPEIDRYEFTPVTQKQLADDHNDRVAFYGRQAIGKWVGLSGRAGVWKDQTDEGGDAEIGFDVEDLFFDGSRFEASGFGTHGRFTDDAGWRASISAINPHSIWRLGYEFTLNRIDGFQNDNNDIPQHRIGASWETHSQNGWDFSLNGALLLYDSETAVLTSLLLQKSF